ncbi:molybdenum cofactor biosynthesis protein C [Caldalkalibacillus thermarum TA2.A1]|uniref:Cyclic pyranopterin monophosphate synthase n=1 Tax=Caldalkalibacillus thermarum (strain TA2.A1) TaxID=986075 RepID=F5L6N8_CALTT|nr:cyclic pyranopterin monophosphate synthase MoaC [Caldalkalibacillus thermarum]EGL82989.1 molybdenum cofactor biosynthesis protein C [Caldalkalibacillus thermarum TA2.A1]QZT34586.1 cyclic pyranopterin monophosphate synthase MoaC [Caldalkalibacillus thermarum TA2.A1]GGK26710.1 cyclic pyranopterin monophosphate synthase accessory protein [Caldalkalibacillus thermarum]
MSSFTHFNEQGRARMVDVSHKPETKRTAVAFSQVQMPLDVLEHIEQGKVKKGDVLGVAQVAGVMAAKNTAQWIPMCHPLPLTGIDIHFEPVRQEGQAVIKIYAEVKTTGKTGVEMEALTAAQAAALTIYDMCKALDKGLVIGPTYLLKKTGGKSGDFEREEL